MRDDHLTFLVLAGAVTLLAFTTGAVPALLLPPTLHSATRIRRERRRRGRHSTPGYPGGRLGVPGAGRARESRKPASPGAGVNMPRRPMATRGGFDSRPVADAAASGDRRIDCMSTMTYHHGRAPVAFARATTLRRPTPRTAPGTSIRPPLARPDRPERPRRTHESA